MAIVKISDLPLVDSPVEGTDLFVVVQDNVTKKAYASDIQTYVGFEEVQTATAGQTVFNLTTMTYAAGANNLMVFVDGVNQYEGSSYTETDNNTVTFTQGLHEGALVKFSTVQTQTSSVANAGAVVYNPAGAGAVPSSVQTKLREFAVTPEDFGAIGDNVTDDLTAVQAAFNSGFPVYLPNQYFISSTATLPQNTTVFGAGPASMIRSSGALPVVTLIGTSGSHKSNLILRDFTIKRVSGTYASSRQLVEYKFADDCVIDGVIFDGDIATSSYPGNFIGYGVDSLRIENCQFINGAGCNLTSSDVTTSGTWSNNCIVKNCYKAPAAVQGFNFYYARNLVVDGCIAHGQTSTFGCGFVVEYECENVTLTNCIAYDNTRSGFYLEGNVAYGVKNVTLNNCIGYSNGECGITLDANYFNIAVTGGAYHSNTGTFAAGTGHGISAAANLGVTISGAIISDNASHGIVWLSNPYQFSISNCLIRENGGYGIYFTGTVGVGVLSGNAYFNNTSGSVFGWQESGGSYLDGPWVSWTPTWYKNDGVTTIAVSAQSAAYKRVGNTVFYSARVTFSGTPDVATHFTIPIAGAWPNGSTGDVAARPRGTAYGAATTFSGVNGIYSNSWLRVLTTAAGDTTLSVQGAYEIA